MSNRAADDVVVNELINWLERADISRMNVNQELEERTHIWEYGKWCAQGALHRLGYQPQLNYRGSNPVSTAWDAIGGISDDLGMLIHEATVKLDPEQMEIIDRIYIRWQPIHYAIEQMRIRRQWFFDARRDALKTIYDHLRAHR